MKTKIVLTFSTFLIVLNIQAQIPLTGLERYYPFTGNPADSSGNNQHGTVIGASLTADRFGSENAAYSFDGSASNYIDIPNNNLNIDQYSYSVWAYLYSIPDFAERYWVLGIGSIAGDQFFSYNNDYSANGYYLNGWGCTGYNITSPHCFIYENIDGEESQWYNLVITRSSTASTFYINGELVDSIEVTPENTPYYGSGELIARIGNRWGYDFPFHGKIDDIGFWNRPLTAEEVAGIYNDCKISISEQPLNQVVNIGDDATFSIEVSGTDLVYQWQSNIGFGFQNLSDAGQYSGTNTNILTIANTTLANDNQLFKCLVSSGDCLIRSNEVSLAILDGVGIEEADHQNIFSVFPNPSSGKFNIVFNQTDLNGSNLIITNTLGQEVFNYGNLKNETSFDLSNLCNKGIYFTHLIDPKGKHIGTQTIFFE